VRLLVLGGTQFVGRALAAAALEAGHEVSLFHRGRTNPDLFPEAEHLLGDRDGGLDALAGGRWDACVDTSGYLPRVVRASAELLRDSVDAMVFISTISVYANLARGWDEHGPLATLDDPAVEEIGGGTYGGLKALCEQAVVATFEDRATVVRPGYVVGPHDHTGRFTWWVRRGARGGTMPLPASIARRAQFVDVRDLADFLLLTATKGLAGTFNATGPEPAIGMRDVLAEAARQSSTQLELVEVPDADVTSAGVEFPLWVDDPDWAAWAEVDVTRARAAGLCSHPVAETVSATLELAPTVEGVGPTAEQEALLLA
jgi:nucleoside-diphosphate-sugar epimerase